MTSMSGGGNQDSLATVTNFDYDGDQNSCSSAQLSIEISDAYSQDGKMGRPQIKPPIPAIIGSHSSSNNRFVFEFASLPFFKPIPGDPFPLI